MSQRGRFFLAIFALLSILGNMAVIAQENKGEVVVYTAHDRQFSEPILELFEERTGITVRPVYDSEAVKTVGLVNRLLSERARPRCDIFWNNEILRSIQLKNEGLTESYDSPSAEKIPATFRDKDNHWTGFGARARVIMTNNELVPEGERPTSAADLADPKWKGRAAFAKPLFGTTNTHAAALWSEIGPEKTKEFFTAIMENAVMETGNAQARDAAVAGEVAWCLTDTDDAYGAMTDGADATIIYADAGPDLPGAILIPNTVVLIKGSPNQDNGKALIDFLLSEEVEALLAKSRAAQIPVRENVPGPEKLPKLSEAQILDIDWEKAYHAIAPVNEFLTELVNQP